MSGNPSGLVDLQYQGTRTSSASIPVTFDENDWSRPKTITVHPASDDDHEDNSVSIVHTVEGYGDFTEADSIAVAVTDIDEPAVLFEPDQVSLVEGETAEITVKLATKPSGTVTVSLSSSNDNAATVSPATLTFTAGDWNNGQEVTVTTVDDKIDNTPERTATITHTASGGGYGAVTGEVAVSVADNETRGLKISRDLVTVTEASGSAHTATYTVALSSQPTAGVTVSLSSGDTNAATVSPATLTFTASNWSDAQTVTVTGVDDEVEQTGEFGYRGTNISHTARGGDYGTVSGSVRVIVSDDGNTPRFYIEDAKVSEGDSGDVNLKFTVILSPVVHDLRTGVTWTANKAGTTYTATSGIDYREPTRGNKTVVFLPGDFSKTLTVVVKGDEVDEDDETVTVTLEQTRAWEVNGNSPNLRDRRPGLGRAVATGTIIDDDTRGVAISKEQIALIEGGTFETYTLKLLSQPTEEVTINVSGNPSGLVDLQYQGTRTSRASIPVTFDENDWNRPKTITVHPVSDDDHEDDSVSIVHTVEGYGNFTEADSISVTVTDIDEPAVLFKPDQVSLVESGTATYTVKLATKPSGTVTVSLSSSNDNAATVSPATLTFTAGSWSNAQTVTVTAVDDKIVNTPERTATITHSASGGGYGAVTGGVAVSVTDDDTRGLKISRNLVTVTEAAGSAHTATYTVALSSQPTAGVTVSLSSGNTDAATVSPATLTFTASNWSDAQTVTVTGVDDEVEQTGEFGYRSTSISHAARGGDYGTVSGSVRVIVSDDGSTPKFYIKDAKVSEGDSGDVNLTFTVILFPVVHDLHTGVTWIHNKEGTTYTATSGIDYREPTRGNKTVVFYPGDFSKTLTVVVRGDEVDEVDETVTVTLDETRAWEVNNGSWQNRRGRRPGLGRAVATGTIIDDDTRGVAISREEIALIEEGTPETYTLRLLSQPTEEVTINVSGNPSRLVVLQYQGTSASIAPIPVKFDENDWSHPKTVTVHPASDDDHEDNSMSIVHTVAGYGDFTEADSISVTLTDIDEPAVLFESNEVSLKEGETATYTVKLATKPSGTVTVTPISDDTGIATVSGALSLNSTNWKSGLTVTVTGAQDENGATDTTSISHTVAGYHDDITRVGPVSVTVADDDAALVLTRGDNSSITNDSIVFVYEGLPVTVHQKYKVRLAAQPGGTVTVTPVSQDETRVSVSRPLTFDKNNWAVDQFVELTGLLDEDGNNEQVKINHTVTGYDAQPVSVNTTVRDYHGHTLVVEPRELGILEGKTGTYSVKLRTDPKSTVTVTPGVDNESAASVSGALTFNSTNWSIPQKVTVTVKEDEARGRKSVTITNEVSGYPGYRKTHPGGWFLHGNDNPDVSTVALTTVDPRPGVSHGCCVWVVEGASITTGFVKLVKEPLGTVTVSVVSLDESIATVSPATFEFTTENWDVFQNITVTGVEDDIVNEIVGGRIVNENFGERKRRETEIVFTFSGDYADAETDATIIVYDNDTRGLALSRDAVSVTEADVPGRTETYTVALTTLPTAEVTVSLSSTDEKAATISPATLTFSASNWKVGQTVTVTSVRDYLVNDTDRTTEILHTASGGDYGGISGKVAVTVTDDDAPPTLTLALSESSITESGGVSTVTAELSRVSGEAVTVTVSAAPVSPAASGDYTLSANKTLTIAAGTTASTGTVTITAVDNDADAPDKQVTVSGTASGGRGAANPADQTLTIADDDGAVSLLVSPTSVAEADEASTATVTATLPGAARSAATTITVKVGDSADAATEGTDYATVADLTLTIAAGQTSGSVEFTMDPTQDTIDEGTGETLSISGTTTASGLSVTGTQMTIIDDDATLTLLLSESTITEDGGVSTVTAELSGASSEAVTVTVSAAPVSPAASEDYTLSGNTTLTIAAGATTSTGTVTITSVDNDTDAPDKQVTVSGTASGGRGAADPADQTLTITDDDGAVALSVSPISVAEADDAATATVTATLPGAVRSAATTITVKVGDSADSATEGTDYATVADLTLTIAAGATNGTAGFSMDPTQDTIDEGAGETLSISGTTAASGLSVTGTQMTITDDDATPTLTLALSESTITEDGGVSTVTAELSGVSSEAVTVTVSAAPVSPAVSGDYTVSDNTTLTIAAGATASTGTVTITAVDNEDDAADKQVTVSGTASGGRGGGGSGRPDADHCR